MRAFDHFCKIPNRLVEGKRRPLCTIEACLVSETIWEVPEGVARRPGTPVIVCVTNETVPITNLGYHTTQRVRFPAVSHCVVTGDAGASSPARTSVGGQDVLGSKGRKMLSDEYLEISNRENNEQYMNCINSGGPTGDNGLTCSPFILPEHNNTYM